MQHTQQSSTARRNILVGLAVGTGAIATGCEAPQPASLENSGMAGLDYSNLDYSKLDYSKLDYGKLDPSQMGEFDLSKVPGIELSDELKLRLDKAIDRAYEKQLGDDVIVTLKNTIGAIKKADSLFQEHELCW